MMQCANYPAYLDQPVPDRRNTPVNLRAHLSRIQFHLRSLIILLLISLLNSRAILFSELATNEKKNFLRGPLSFKYPWL